MAQFLDEILYRLRCKFIFGHFAQIIDTDPFIGGGFTVLQNDAAFINGRIAQVFCINGPVSIIELTTDFRQPKARHKNICMQSLTMARKLERKPPSMEMRM